MKKLLAVFLVFVLVMVSVFSSGGIYPKFITVEAAGMINAYEPINPILKSDSYLLQAKNWLVDHTYQGSWIKFEGVDFGDGSANAFEFEASTNQTSDRPIQVRKGSLTGDIIGSGFVKPTGGWTNFEVQRIDLEEEVSGVHDIYIIFNQGPGAGTWGGNFKWFRFLSLIDAYEQINPIWNDGYYAMDVYDSFIEYVGTDAWIKFESVDFGDTIIPNTFEMEYSSASTLIRPVEIRLDSLTGELIGSGTITSTGGWYNFIVYQIELNEIVDPLGVRDVYIRFNIGMTGPGGNYKWFRFLDEASIDDQTPISGLYATADTTIFSAVAQTTPLQVSALVGTAMKVDLPQGTVLSYGTTNSQVVTVNTNGIVTAQGEGTAEITVSTVIYSINYNTSIQFDVVKPFYVSPSGSDLNNGTLNAPFETIEKAQLAVRNEIANGMTSDVVVYLRSGVYNISSTITFNNSDSGRNGYFVKYLAYPGEEPIIDGGVPLTGWTAVDSNIYKTQIDSGWDVTSGTINAYEPINPILKSDSYLLQAKNWLVDHTYQGSWIKFEDVDFGDSISKVFEFEVSTNQTADRPIQVRSGSLTGEILGNGFVKPTGGWSFFKVQRIILEKEVTGVHDIYIIFNQGPGEGAWGGNFKWFRFRLQGFLTMFENDERSHLARYPNKGGAREGYLNTAGPMVTADPFKKFHFNQGDIPAGLDPSSEDLEIVIWPSGTSGIINWRTDTKKIVDIDYNTKMITLESNAGYEIGVGSRYYIQGSSTMLNAPGEFYFNEAEGYLYYWPVNSQIHNQEIVAPKLHRLLNFQGSSGTNMVENITIEGLTLRNTNRDVSGNYGSGSIHLINAKAITIKDNHIHGIGSTAIHGSNSTQYCNITGNLINDVGTIGIMFHGNTNTVNNQITNNVIHGIGVMQGQGHGIRLSHAHYNTISHNRIFDSTRYAISIKTGATNNLVQYNDVFDCNTDSNDTGVIEAWMSNDNVIDHNRIYNSEIHFGFGFGIYLDDYSSGFMVSNNILHGLQKNGLGHLRNPIVTKGTGNQFVNNYIVNNPQTSYGAFGAYNAFDLSISRNIMHNSGNAVYHHSNWHNDRVEYADYQLLYNQTGIYNVNGVPNVTTFTQWKTIFNNKYDQNSLIGNPKFMNESKDDYRIRYDSPARTIGIEDIDLANMGLLDTFKFASHGDTLEYIYPVDVDRMTISVVNLSSQQSILTGILGRTVTGFISDLNGANISYMSNNPNVATVNSSGRVTAKGAGVAEITVTVVRGGQTIQTNFHVVVN